MQSNTIAEKYKFTSYQVFVVIALALTQFTVVLDFMVMSPLGDMLIKSMNLSTSQFGTAVSCYAFSAGVSGILAAGFADKFDRKKLLLFFYVGFIGGTLCCGLANTYPLLVAARIVTGIFGGVIGSISMAIVADLYPIQERGRVMGFMQMGFGAAQVLGIPISLFLANIWGWHSPFLMIVGLGTVVWLLIGIKMQPVTEHLKLQNDKNALLHLWHTVQKKHYRIGFTAMAILAIGGFMMMPWGSAYAINNLHITTHQLPMLFMAAGVSTLIIMPIIGKLSDKIDKFKIFTAGSCWMIIMVLIYTNMPVVPFVVVMFMNIFFMVGIMGRMVPAMALNTALPQMQDRGAFMSISSSLQQISGGVGAYISGLIVVQQTKTSPLEHYNTLGIVVSLLTLITIFLMYRISKLIKEKTHLKQV
jgi:MFS family permease